MSYMKKINAKNPILKNGDIFVTYGYMCPEYGSAHYGTDIRTSTLGKADEIIAIEDGEIIAVKKSVKSALDLNVKENWNSPDALGNNITIKHNDNFNSRYGHIAYGSIKVKIGDKVKKGDAIGTMGMTGLTSGMHCHFEIWQNGVRIDGEPFITGEREFKDNVAEPVKLNKTITEIAKEVIAGKWNNGDERKMRLEAAGYDFNEVQTEVNRLLTTTDETIAEVVYTVNTAKLNIRTEASIGARLAGNPVKLGTKLKDNGKAPVKADGYTWINVVHDGLSCWVAKEYLK